MSPQHRQSATGSRKLREFRAAKADQLWVADITETPIRSSKLYLAALIDDWSRKVVWECDVNAMAESFFAILECELLNIIEPFKCHVEAEANVFEYIEGFYNTRRRHSRLNQLSRIQFDITMAS